MDVVDPSAGFKSLNAAKIYFLIPEAVGVSTCNVRKSDSADVLHIYGAGPLFLRSL